MTIISRIVAAVALIGLSLSGASAMAADDVDAGTNTQNGSCTYPGSNIWSPYGAYTRVTADSRITWHTHKHLTIDWMNSSSTLYGCNNGAVYAGGQKQIRFNTSVHGQGISSCGIPSGCNMSDTIANFDASTGWSSNTTGRHAYNRGGGDIWARDLGGQLNYFNNNVTAQFKYNGIIAERTVSQNWQYGD